MNNRLLVFSDDWGRHPSSCQHLIGQLLPNAQTTWVNTIGMRPPRFDTVTLRRGFEKLSGWVKPASKRSEAIPRPLPDGLTVIDAKMWPWMSHRWDRWLNARLLISQLHDIAEGAIAVTTIPIVADLVGKLPVDRWIYYCVDDFSVWPGLDGQAMGKMESEMLPQIDRIIAASDTLAAGIADRGHHAEVLTHGVDLDFWQSDSGCKLEILDGLPRPIALFWGVIDRRMNADWLLALANRIDHGKIVLVGPLQDPDPRLANHPNILMTGPMPFESLPSVARQAAALIMPYADLPVTRAMQPLKFKEYLATMRPVVASSLPAVHNYSDCIEMVSTNDEFVAKTMAFMQGDVDAKSPFADRIQKRLATESWKAKAATFQEMLSSSRFIK
ncbi:hypothetical protein Q31b_18880 [Novipirellula aureliae]|uniref:Teichuronic acid biosynthesis glycosyltransferase TuaH n=1 Tax=Novipirellula aureliae TaxID=2527966 RepID=A0A5C6E606_9BACT|nr:glycosyltransferase [Novipirellula aureliae]TWU44352.1 hypothetical protein Q31b_18880 [Novipirellula aureliae]